MTSSLIIAGCSRRKRSVCAPIPALELYEGGCIPYLRSRLGDQPGFRARIRILSGLHGLIDADRPLLPYDVTLTPARVEELRPLVEAALHRECVASGPLVRVLVAASARYQDLVAGFLRRLPEPPRLSLISDPHDWAAVSTVLDEWGWP